MSDDAEHNRRAILQVETLINDVFVGCALEAHRSIQSGSEITGAPGQPVDIGNLRNSIAVEFDNPQHATTATIGTPVEYAEAIEDGVGRFGPLTLRSKVGGWHSFKQTVAAFDRIKNVVVRRVNAQRVAA